MTAEVLIGPNRLPEALPDDLTPTSTALLLKKLMEPPPRGEGLSRDDAAFKICTMAAEKFGFALEVRKERCFPLYDLALGGTEPWKGLNTWR